LLIQIIIDRRADAKEVKIGSAICPFCLPPAGSLEQRIQSADKSAHSKIYQR